MADDLYQQLREHVREMNKLLKSHRTQPRRSRERTGAPDARLLELCAGAFNTSPKEVLANSRQQEMVFARHLYCYIRHRHHGISPEQIGAELGRHRTTVLNSLKKAADLLQVDREFKKKYNEVMT